MLSLGDMYPEILNADSDLVTIHGYSFERKAHNKKLFDETVRIVVPRLPKGMELDVAIVCPDGILAFEQKEHDEKSESGKATK